MVLLLLLLLGLLLADVSDDVVAVAAVAVAAAVAVVVIIAVAGVDVAGVVGRFGFPLRPPPAHRFGFHHDRGRRRYNCITCDLFYMLAVSAEDVFRCSCLVVGAEGLALQDTRRCEKDFSERAQATATRLLQGAVI